MTIRREEMRIAIAFVGLLGAELVAHWVLSSGSWPTLRLFYLSNDKRSSITMLVDSFIPGAVLGFINGYTGCEWTTRKLNISAVLLAGAVTGSHFLYSVFFPKVLLWWWPPTWGEGTFWFLMAVVFTFFFTQLGRNVQSTRHG
jgi:hypothetical protein